VGASVSHAGTLFDNTGKMSPKRTLWCRTSKTLPYQQTALMLGKSLAAGKDGGAHACELHWSPRLNEGIRVASNGP
jgi:hypothetical protein